MSIGKFVQGRHKGIVHYCLHLLDAVTCIKLFRTVTSLHLNRDEVEGE